MRTDFHEKTIQSHLNNNNAKALQIFTSPCVPHRNKTYLPVLFGEKRKYKKG